MKSRRVQFGKPRSALLAVAASCLAVCPAAVPQTPLTAAASEGAAGLVTTPGVSTKFISDAMHMVVGRSMFINTTARLRRVYVSNPDVLDSFTASPRQIVVTAKAPGVSSLVLWDENGGSQSYVISSDADISSLRTALHDALPSDN